MSDLQHEVRSVQRLIEFSHLEKRLVPRQTMSIRNTMAWMIGYSKRRWWFIGYPDPQPPSRLRAVLLGLVIVGIFSVLNTAINGVMVTVGPQIGIPYSLIFMGYLLLAVPLSVITIANLAARLHLLDWGQSRA